KRASMGRWKQRALERAGNGLEPCARARTRSLLRLTALTLALQLRRLIIIILLLVIISALPPSWRPEMQLLSIQRPAHNPGTACVEQDRTIMQAVIASLQCFDLIDYLLFAYFFLESSTGLGQGRGA
ncbi:hypothetical protein T310_9079, partial [Rasamsonia emersonii CBS 393.64]